MIQHKANAIFDPKIIKIDENKYISSQLFEYRGKCYYDVIFNNEGEEKFIGRFDKENSIFETMYQSEKILVCYKEYNNINSSLCISKVACLYDIIDDTFFACTEEQAISIFDENYKFVNLTNKDNHIVRSDLIKKKQLVKKRTI